MVHLFLIESLFLGAVGTVVGALFGVAIAAAVSLVQYGYHSVQHFPYGREVIVLFWGCVAGLVLSVVGAVGPALKAARMQPVEALRVEE